MEPSPVGIQCGGSAERPLQPSIIASGKALERETACLTELVNIVLERLIAKETAPTLIPTLHRRDVSQEGANRVTGVILQMIQFRNAQSFNGGECGLARVEENAHQPPDRGRVTWQGLETE